ncbi:hypothetical protein NLM16_34720 [Bradyrhizobium brasilense]|uniref:hypothetical protein n=1 Tax=Bradyrhizobium brasilense TaxID=1419277 RepID=UPI00287751CC|nr:hypothetical protein [Bradyrhizobium brasilense]MCP3419273.1 hypothetical protein [Bradyrhizobium brasilense]
MTYGSNTIILNGTGDTVYAAGDAVAPHSENRPKTGYALEIDGRIKTEFSIKEGADHEDPLQIAMLMPQAFIVPRIAWGERQ